MYDLSLSLGELQNDESADTKKKRVILMTKRSLLSMCFDKINEYIAKTDPDTQKIMTHIKQYDARLFNASVNVLTQQIEENEQLRI